ncbi:MAG: 30S ribosomal protein S13 [Candidatus Dojkabacteria bacterium]|uniref:Small ribosomal subunit protein uS13 n=1 Tax=Candidatus Dojkabacteria bacterium TaxID=2099670 RepID=A0A952ALM0_9BACT|nr:30S ribosomal protein S13 [Candidatus Dojkabacteria bacterium]WKZ27880.1 MAG: 30S ribosomal protein S13 [Candidatus Dojkabacteria bacterium]
MARIAGVELPINKRVEIALTYIHGVGLTTSQKILKQTNISTDIRVKDLSEAQIKRISSVLSGMPLEGELKEIVFRNVKRLKDIRAYRGIRHKLGLPVRGQRTRTNAVTRKGRNNAVGGLKRKLEKT